MTIRRQDGSIYRLTGPNLLTKSQEKWDNRDLIFHNFCWDYIKSSPIPKPIIAPPPKKVEIPIVEPKVEVIIEEIPPPSTTVKNKVLFHCLPATLKSFTDDLYGDTYERAVYGDKFTFEGVILSRGSLSISFWTNITIGNLSIIYPIKYIDNTERLGEYQWWKITESVEKENGFIYTTIISDLHPSF